MPVYTRPSVRHIAVKLFYGVHIDIEASTWSCEGEGNNDVYRVWTLFLQRITAWYCILVDLN